MTILKTCSLVGLLICSAVADEPIRHEVDVIVDLPYRSGDSLTEYERERCRLDVYLPKGEVNFATLIWFHGGGLKTGDKSPTISGDSVNTALIAMNFAEVGIAVVVPNYRLSPKATYRFLNSWVQIDDHRRACCSCNLFAGRAIPNQLSLMDRQRLTLRFLSSA